MTAEKKKHALFKLLLILKVRNSRITKMSYETKLHKMTSNFELLTRSRKIKIYTSSF